MHAQIAHSTSHPPKQNNILHSIPSSAVFW